MASMDYTVYTVGGRARIACGCAPELPPGAQVILVTGNGNEAVDAKARANGNPVPGDWPDDGTDW